MMPGEMLFLHSESRPFLFQICIVPSTIPRIKHVIPKKERCSVSTNLIMVILLES